MTNEKEKLNKRQLHIFMQEQQKQEEQKQKEPQKERTNDSTSRTKYQKFRSIFA